LFDPSFVDKHVISKQIVVYKNIFKNNKLIIDYLENYKEGSLIMPWETWFDHGYRTKSFYSRKNNYDNNDQSVVLKEIADIFDFIKNDYLNDFEKEKGIWPDWVRDWDNFREKDQDYIVDYFKYDWEQSLNNMEIRPNGIMMNYHVDEFPIDGIIKEERNIVTINFYLNDNYDGGEICAYDSISNVSYKYKPKAGDAVVMPSTVPFYHAVKEFKNNDRYFLRLFISQKNNNSRPSYITNNINEETIKNHTGTEIEEEYRKNFLQFIDVAVEEIEVL
jgi:hypothetical protein